MVTARHRFCHCSYRCGQSACFQANVPAAKRAVRGPAVGSRFEFVVASGAINQPLELLPPCRCHSGRVVPTAEPMRAPWDVWGLLISTCIASAAKCCRSLKAHLRCGAITLRLIHASTLVADAAGEAHAVSALRPILRLNHHLPMPFKTRLPPRLSTVAINGVLERSPSRTTLLVAWTSLGRRAKITCITEP